MAVQIPADVEASIRAKVETGRYPDAGEVVREAMRVLEARDRLRDLRASIAEGNAAIERGEGIELTSELWEELEREAEERERRGERPHPDVCP